MFEKKGRESPKLNILEDVGTSNECQNSSSIFAIQSLLPIGYLHGLRDIILE